MSNSNLNKLTKQSNTKNIKQALQLLDGFIPLIIEIIPEQYKNKPLSNIISELMNTNNENLSKFLTYIVYENKDIISDQCNTSTDNDTKQQQINDDNLFKFNTPFNAFKNLCTFISSENDKKLLKQMSIILSLPSKTIIEKDLKLNIAGINVTETIKNCINNNISHNIVDKILLSTNIIITKLLTKTPKQFNFTMLLKLVEELNNKS